LSIIPVVGSSRISNTVYLAVASLYWTAILSYLGYDFGVSIDAAISTAIVVFPLATGIGVILWAFKFEKKFYDRILPWLILRQGEVYKDWMATDIMLVKPWQSAVLDLIPIRYALKYEVETVLKGKELKEDLEAFYQLFWLFWSAFPFFYLLGSNIVSLWATPLIVPNFVFASLLGFSLVAIPLIYPRIHRRMQILSVAYIRWLSDTISDDTRRRIDNPRFKQLKSDVHRTSTRESIQQFSRDLMGYISAGNWDRLDKGMNRFIRFKAASLPLWIRKIDFDDIIQDIIWTYRLAGIDSTDYLSIMGEKNAFLQSMENISDERTINSVFSHFIRSNTREQIVDILSEIRTSGSSSKDVKFIEIALRELISSGAINDLDKLLLYLREEHLSILSNQTFQSLRVVPYYFSEQRVPRTDFRHNMNQRPAILAKSFIEDAEKGLLNYKLILQAVTNWGVKPEVYISYIKEKGANLLLEKEFGLSPSDLIPVIEEILNKCGIVDEESACDTLGSMRKQKDFIPLLSKIDHYCASRVTSEKIKAITRIVKCLKL
jgi:hypothetical protein